MADYGQAKYRAGYQGFLKWNPEDGMLAPSATTLGAAPAYAYNAGYIQVPSVRQPQGAQQVESVGAYRPAATMIGNRNPTMGLQLQLGDPTILTYGLRSSGLGEVGGQRCLPVLALKTGAIDGCGNGTAFSWEMRYALINSMGISFSSGQAVSANIEAMGVAVNTAASTETTFDNLEEDDTLGSVLTFHHVDWVIGGTAYREILQSVSIQVSNSIRPLGPARRESATGDADPLSRGPSALGPGMENLQVSYRLFDKLPGALFDAAARAGNWGGVTISASDAAANAVNPKTLTAVIDNNRISDQSMEGVGANSEFGFSASTVSRYLALTVS